jgi:hypothetical protein
MKDCDSWGEEKKEGAGYEAFAFHEREIWRCS